MSTSETYKEIRRESREEDSSSRKNRRLGCSEIEVGEAGACQTQDPSEPNRGFGERKRAHAASILRSRKEQALMGKRFRHGPDLEAESVSDNEDTGAEIAEDLFTDLCSDIKSDELETRVYTLKRFAQLFVEPSNLVKKYIIEGECIQLLKNSLQSQSNEEIFQAAWCVTNLAAGHNSVCSQVLPLVPTLLTLLLSKETKIQKQAAWAIGNLAADGPEFRYKIQESNCVLPLIALLYEEDVELVRQACFALSKLTRLPNSSAEELLKHKIVASLATLLEDDQMVLAYSEIYWVLAYLTAETELACERIIHCGLMGNIVKHLSELCGEESQAIPIIRIVGNLTSQGDRYSDVFLNNSTFLPVLFRCLVSEVQAIQKEALWALSNITAGQPSNTEIVAAAGVVSILTPLVLSGEFHIRQEAGYSIMNILVKGPEFLSLDDIKALIPGFHLFVQSKDSGLIELGLHFFIAIIQNYPDPIKEFHTTTFVQDVEDVINNVSAPKVQQSAKLLLKQCSELSITASTSTEVSQKRTVEPSSN